MSDKEKAPKSGAFTGNSRDISNEYYTRKTSQRKLEQTKLMARYVVELAHLVSELPYSGYEEEFWKT